MQTVRANAKTRHCTDEDLKMEIIEGDSISRYMYKNCLDFFQGQHGGWSLKQLPAAPVVSLLHSTNTTKRTVNIIPTYNNALSTQNPPQQFHKPYATIDGYFYIIIFKTIRLLTII